MTLNDYQAKAQQYATYPKEIGIIYTAIGLNGEAGDVANKVKKILKDDTGVISNEMQQSLIHKLGDVLWYVSEMACNLGITMEKIAQENINKLEMDKRNTKSTLSDEYIM